MILLVISIIVVLFVAAGKTQKMTVVIEGNLSKQPLPMTLNKFQDGECGMIIDDLTYASQVIAPDGKTWFFHDHGGMAGWLKTKRFAKTATIWVRDRQTDTWIDGRKAWYSRTESTPMLYGFGAYADSASGYVDFNTMQMLMLRGETMADPVFRKYLMSEPWKQ